MKSKHVVLYVPGLGDHRLKMRQRGLDFWYYRNISIEMAAKKWRVPESWDIKLAKLLKQIDYHYDQGKIVSLIGESAGATAVLQALEDRYEKINAVILLCGKSQYPNRVANVLYKKNPALEEAMIRSHQVVQQLSVDQKKKILNLHPYADPVVPVWETRIEGVRESTMPIIGHITGIAFGITLWSFVMVRFIRRQAKGV